MKLHLLLLSDDISYHFKFNDVMSDKAKTDLKDSEEKIDEKKSFFLGPLVNFVFI